MTSVIIVTYNRKRLLTDCLNSVLGQNDPGAFEVIVVDNHSPDKTADLIRDDFQDRVKFVSAGSRVSLVKAKELGLNASAGDIIAFTDDDCAVSKDWLKETNKTLALNDLAGGAVLPADSRLPGWWKSSLNWLIGINPSPDSKFPPLGSNIACRRQVLEKIRTDPSIKELLPYGEDNYRVKKALAAGFSMGINKDMIVYHQIPAKKLTIPCLFKRSWQEGRCLVSYNKHPGDIAYNLLSLPLNLLRALFFLDLNRFFRMIVNLSFLFNRLKYPENER